MQFNIDGRFLAELRWEDNAWSVSAATPDALPRADDVADFASAEDNDIADWLDAIFLESVDKLPDSEPAPG